MDDAAGVGFFEVNVDDVAAVCEYGFDLPQRQRGFACGHDTDDGVPTPRIQQLDLVVSCRADAELWWHVGAV